MTGKDKNELGEIREQLEKLLERSKKAFSRGRDEVVRLGQIAKFKLEVVNHEREQRQLFEDMGRGLSAAAGKKNFDKSLLTKALQQSLDKLSKVNKKISDIHSQISQLEKGLSAGKGKKGAAKKKRKKQ